MCSNFIFGTFSITFTLAKKIVTIPFSLIYFLLSFIFPKKTQQKQLLSERKDQLNRYFSGQELSSLQDKWSEMFHDHQNQLQKSDKMKSKNHQDEQSDYQYQSQEQYSSQVLKQQQFFKNIEMVDIFGLDIQEQQLSQQQQQQQLELELEWNQDSKLHNYQTNQINNKNNQDLQKKIVLQQNENNQDSEIFQPQQMQIQKQQEQEQNKYEEKKNNNMIEVNNHQLKNPEQEEPIVLNQDLPQQEQIQQHQEQEQNKYEEKKNNNMIEVNNHQLKNPEQEEPIVLNQDLPQQEQIQQHQEQEQNKYEEKKNNNMIEVNNHQLKNPEQEEPIVLNQDLPQQEQIQQHQEQEQNKYEEKKNNNMIEINNHQLKNPEQEEPIVLRQDQEISLPQQEPQQPKQLANPDCLIWIQKLYEVSCNARDVPEEFKSFVGPPQDQAALIDYYAGENEGITDFLKAQLQGFRRIRGDGNCFYTAFVYQYLNLLLKGNDGEIEEIKKMAFRMKYNNNFEIPEEKQNQLANCLCNRLLLIKQQPNIELALYEAISNPNDTFYGLSILYIRNLVNQLYQKNEMAKVMVEEDLSEDFLFWEKECNYNEVVIAFLASDLKLQITVILVDSINDIKNSSGYGDEGNHKIHLILAPGHYQIGLP